MYCYRINIAVCSYMWYGSLSPMHMCQFLIQKIRNSIEFNNKYSEKWIMVKWQNRWNWMAYTIGFGDQFWVNDEFLDAKISLFRYSLPFMVTAWFSISTLLSLYWYMMVIRSIIQMWILKWISWLNPIK